MKEIVSVIMPVYNSEKYVLDAMNSVLTQNYKHWKLYVIDDNSSDNSKKIIRDMEKLDNRIIFIGNTTNLGPAKSRNKGIRICNGRYITFLDSDDIWHDNFLRSQLEFIEKNEAALVFSSYLKKDEKLEKIYGFYKVPSKIDFNDLLKDNCITCLTAMYDSKKCGKVYFNEKLKHEDYIMWLDILKNFAKFAYGNSEVLATYRIHRGSVNRNKVRAGKWRWEIYRRYLRFNIVKTLYYFAIYTLYAIRKNYKHINQT